MKTFKFENKKARMKLYFVLIFVLLISIILFMKTDKEIMVSIIYLAAALYSFINVTRFVKKSKSSINSIIIDNNLITINFMHIMVDPFKFQLNEICSTIDEDKLILREIKNGNQIIIEKDKLINKLEWDELLDYFKK